MYTEIRIEKTDNRYQVDFYLMDYHGWAIIHKVEVFDNLTLMVQWIEKTQTESEVWERQYNEENGV